MTLESIKPTARIATISFWVWLSFPFLLEFSYIYKDNLNMKGTNESKISPKDFTTVTHKMNPFSMREDF